MGICVTLSCDNPECKNTKEVDMTANFPKLYGTRHILKGGWAFVRDGDVRKLLCRKCQISFRSLVKTKTDEVTDTFFSEKSPKKSAKKATKKSTKKEKKTSESD